MSFINSCIGGDGGRILVSGFCEPGNNILGLKSSQPQGDPVWCVVPVSTAWSACSGKSKQKVQCG